MQYKSTAASGSPGLVPLGVTWYQPSPCSLLLNKLWESPPFLPSLIAFLPANLVSARERREGDSVSLREACVAQLLHVLLPSLCSSCHLSTYSAMAAENRDEDLLLTKDLEEDSRTELEQISDRRRAETTGPPRCSTELNGLWFAPVRLFFSVRQTEIASFLLTSPLLRSHLIRSPLLPSPQVLVSLLAASSSYLLCTQLKLSEQ